MICLWFAEKNASIADSAAVPIMLVFAVILVHAVAKLLLSGVVCVSYSDGGERAGCEMVHASSGRVYIRQVGRSGAYHHYRLCPAVSGYVFVNGKHSQTVL